MDKSQARLLIGILLALLTVFAIGYFGNIAFLTRGAATSMTGFGLGVVGMAALRAIKGEL
jgi:hypothetical protein